MDSWVGYAIGIGTFLNAVFNFWVIKMHPAFKASGITADSDPYSTYTGGEEVRSWGVLASLSPLACLCVVVTQRAQTHAVVCFPAQSGNESLPSQPP